MSDLEIRRLERAAVSGDKEAHDRLNNAYKRAGLCKTCREPEKRNFAGWCGVCWEKLMTSIRRAETHIRQAKEWVTTTSASTGVSFLDVANFAFDGLASTITATTESFRLLTTAWENLTKEEQDYQRWVNHRAECQQAFAFPPKKLGRPARSHRYRLRRVLCP